MLKIVALNEESDSEAGSDDEIPVTKEAEETIAVSEYMRALKFKANNKNEDAMILFTELLETKVLNEIPLDDKTDKLFSVRYNCHKNIALINEFNNKEEEALEHYAKAMNLDDTEVFIMHRLGQLALKMNRCELAEFAFEKCLHQNPNHWPSADGILQCLCKQEYIMRAYGWALKWYQKNQNYQRAEDVLMEITKKFPSCIPFFEQVFNSSFKPKIPIEDNDKPRVFPSPKPVVEEDCSIKKPNIEQFRQDTFNWLSVGKFIVSLYKHLMETSQSIIFVVSLDDICKDIEDITANESDISSESDESTQNSEESSKSLKLSDPESTSENTEQQKTDDSQSNEVGNFITPSTPPLDQSMDVSTEDKANSSAESSRKPRRRCSDLSFLEQWGWHKNRRYSSRKKSQQDRNEADTTVQSLIRKLFSEHFENTFDIVDEFLNSADSSEEEIEDKFISEEITSQNLQKLTERDFQKFTDELRSQNFDLILIIFLWLKYTSKYWEMPFINELKEMYLEIYELYLNHYDLQTWNLLSNDDFNASFRMGVFYLELDLERAIARAKDNVPTEIDPIWKMIFHHLIFNSGCAFVISDEFYDSNMIRLNWCDFVATTKLENNLPKSVECLEHIESLIQMEINERRSKDIRTNFKMVLPNLNNNNVISLKVVRNLKIDLKRRISLNNVRALYDAEEYEKIIKIITESVMNGTISNAYYDYPLPVQVQFEVLLESLWNLEQFQECLVWSERCFAFAVNQLISAPSDTCRYEEWAENCNYIMLYIEELLVKDYRENKLYESIEEFLPRLVQSCYKILVHQLDTPFDRNFNPTHAINIKRPWIILHQILLRKEDFQLESERKWEETLPQTFLLLFKSHEFLARRQWCTRDHGQLLLYILESILPKIRAPYMDAYRDVISENCEQISYCLYGYPPKKARSKHIEEHDAQQIDLTWKRAIDLYDLYCPEKLPEFDSLKLESISIDMEQLLLKILPLIPKEIDPSAHINNIQDFINGITDTLPGEFMLPDRISSIYYFLADFYFKNRDFQKSIKYSMLDLTCEPTRLNSWAIIALSKANKIDNKINSYLPTDDTEYLEESESALRCFVQCFKIDKRQTVLWIEYAAFAYTLFTYCNRNLKNNRDQLTEEEISMIENRMERYLQISYDSFIIANKTMKTQQQLHLLGLHDEKWFNHFMLGKIAEKRKEHPKVYLDHYLLAAKSLYENNATYPIKINHDNPSTLSIEALEVFYRTSSAIMKYLENNQEISREIGRMFQQILKALATSPFALNKAKIDDNSVNALKRKLAAEKAEAANKQIKLDQLQNQEQVTTVSSSTTTSNESGQIPMDETRNEDENMPSNEEVVPTNNEELNEQIDESNSNRDDDVEIDFEQNIPSPLPIMNLERLREQNDWRNKLKASVPTAVVVQPADDSVPANLNRRGSQESSGSASSSGSNSNSNSSSGSSCSGSSSSGSSGSESESGSDSESDEPDETTPFALAELEPIYRQCIKNLEECITRFPEHYKSIYRLVYHYMNAPEKLKSMDKCHQLLLGQYETALGNTITGLFRERRNSNFFNGIWKIPSAEVDRPGSFSTHLVKCVKILLLVLRKLNDHNILIDMALQLQRTPEPDKRYIKESERTLLYKKALTYYTEIIRNLLHDNAKEGQRNDESILQLCLDIYKQHKKCIKHMNQKEAIFSQLLVDAYKIFIQDKVQKIPENLNLLDLAIRLCTHEITYRKNVEKQRLSGSFTEPIRHEIYIPGLPKNIPPMNPAAIASTSTSTSAAIKINVPATGQTNTKRGRPVGSKNLTTPMMPSFSGNPMNQNLMSSVMDPAAMSAFLAFYGNRNILNSKDMNNFFSEYYKFLESNPQPSTSTAPSPSTNQASSQPNKATSSPKLPQFDMKSLIASNKTKFETQRKSSTSSAQPVGTTITLGDGQLTITPTITATKTSNLLAPSAPLSISLTKLPSPGGISVKPLSELTAPSKPSPKIQTNDLPNSLTITPSTSYDSSKSSLSILPEKLRGSSLSSQANLASALNVQDLNSVYSTIAELQRSSGYIRSELLASTLASLGSTGSQFNNPQWNLLKNCPEILNSNLGSNMDLNSKFSNFQAPNMGPKAHPPIPKKQNQKRARAGASKPRFTPPILPPQTTMTPLPPPSSVSPAPSPSPSPFASRFTPSPQHQQMALQTSPTKTLQQKLAEKQKANQLNNQNNPSTSKSKKKDVDVIILD